MSLASWIGRPIGRSVAPGWPLEGSGCYDARWLGRSRSTRPTNQRIHTTLPTNPTGTPRPSWQRSPSRRTMGRTPPSPPPASARARRSPTATRRRRAASATRCCSRMGTMTTWGCVGFAWLGLIVCWLMGGSVVSWSCRLISTHVPVLTGRSIHSFMHSLNTAGPLHAPVCLGRLHHHGFQHHHQRRQHRPAPAPRHGQGGGRGGGGPALQDAAEAQEGRCVGWGV